MVWICGGQQEDYKKNYRINKMSYKDIMNVHRLDTNNMGKWESLEHQIEGELWVTVMFWLYLLHQMLKVLKNYFGMA